MDENAVGTCCELVFAPIDASFSDDACIIRSGFRIIPLDSAADASSPNCTLDLASALEVGPTGNKASDSSAQCGGTKSRVALALSPSQFGSHDGLQPPPGSSEAHMLARWIYQSYRCYLGVELLKNEASESILKTLWHHSDAVMCYSLKALSVFTFANQAGLDMLESLLHFKILLWKIFLMTTEGRCYAQSSHK